MVNLKYILLFPLLENFTHSVLFILIYPYISRSNPLPKTPNFATFFLNKQTKSHQLHVILYLCSWIGGLQLECRQFAKAYSLRKKWHYFSQELSIVKISSAKSKTYCSPPFYLLLFGLAWDFTDILQWCHNYHVFICETYQLCP